MCAVCFCDWTYPQWDRVTSSSAEVCKVTNYSMTIVYGAFPIYTAMQKVRPRLWAKPFKKQGELSFKILVQKARKSDSLMTLMARYGRLKWFWLHAFMQFQIKVYIFCMHGNGSWSLCEWSTSHPKTVTAARQSFYILYTRTLYCSKEPTLLDCRLYHIAYAGPATVPNQALHIIMRYYCLWSQPIRLRLHNLLTIIYSPVDWCNLLTQTIVPQCRSNRSTWDCYCLSCVARSTTVTLGI